MGFQITSVRDANKWLKSQGRNELKIASRQNSRAGRVYCISLVMKNSERKLMERNSLEEIIQYAVNYLRVTPCF